jgi:hypothetical protein
MKNIYQGNIKINSDNQKEQEKLLSKYDGISGYLYINSNCDLKALKSVGGSLYINSNCDLKALKSVGGYLDIYSNCDLKAPLLKSVGGYLNIYSNCDLKALKSVGGYLDIHSNCDLKAPLLKSVGGYLDIHSNCDLKALKSVGGNLYIYSNCELKALKSVGGYLDIHSKLEEKTAIRLWKNNRNKEWYLSDKANEYLLSQTGKIKYYINRIEFQKEWFDKIRKDQLTPQEIFAIDNVEHRRIAYEYMDKAKMAQLKDFKVLDEQIDGKGKKMRMVSFSVPNVKEPLVFYNCIDASSDREYWLQMDGYSKCWEAKFGMFGLKENEVKLIEEW